MWDISSMMDGKNAYFVEYFHLFWISENINLYDDKILPVRIDWIGEMTEEHLLCHSLSYASAVAMRNIGLVRK